MKSLRPPSLRIVVVAPFAPEAEGGVVAVDRMGLDEAMARLAGTLHLQVEDRLGGGDAWLPVELPLTGLRSLRPEAVAAAVPGLGEVVALRRHAGELAAGRLTVEQFRDRAGAAAAAEVAPPLSPAAPAPVAVSGVDSILDMVDLPEGVAVGERRSTAPTPLGTLIGNLLGPRGHVGDAGAVERLCADLDRRISGQLDAVFSDPTLRAVEAAWRGLALLLGHVSADARVRVAVVSASHDEAAERMASDVVAPWLAGTGEEVGLAVVGHEFGCIDREVAILAALAEAGEALQAPVVVGVAPAFFGCGDWAEVAAIPSLDLHLSSNAYGKWRALREREASRWLVAACNPPLLRGAYGAEAPGGRNLAYDENTSPLWGASPWWVATAACESFGAHGWAGRLEGSLTAPALVAGAARPRATALAVDAEAAMVLTSHGLLPLLPEAGRDRVVIGPTPTVVRPPHYAGSAACREAAARATLGYQLVVGQLARALQEIVATLPLGATDAEVGAEVATPLAALLGLEVESVAAEVGPHPDRPDRRILTLRTRIPEPLLPGRLEVEMAVAIPR